MSQFKERMVRLVEQAADRLQLPSQPALHAVQLLNILIPALPKLAPTLQLARYLAAAVLSLSAKLYEDRPLRMRELIRAVDPRLRQAGGERSEEGVSGRDAGEAVKQLQVAVMKQLRWKLAIPSLYDQAMAVAHAWDAYADNLAEFPMRFHQCEHNMSLLTHNVRICVYNLSQLIKHTHFEGLSARIRNLAIALFQVSMIQLLKEQAQSFILSPRLPLKFLLADFFKKNYPNQLEAIAQDAVLISDALSNYQQFRQNSKKKLSKKTLHKSNKHSEDKENIAYYVNTLKNKPRVIPHTNNCKSRSRSKPEKERSKSKLERSKSRLDKSRSKMEKQTGRKKGKLQSTQLKSKDSIVLKHKKTSSTKIIQHKESSQPYLPKKGIKYSKSRTSKREKSTFNSKIIPSCTLDENFTSKSSYWLKANPLPKTDKKSTNSSIRMKMR